MGMVTDGEGYEHDETFLGHDLLDVGSSYKLLAVAGGIVFNVGCLLLCKGIELIGIAVAFPLCVGTALALGTVLTYLTDTGGSNPVTLFLGVALGVMAVCLCSMCHWLKDFEQRAATEARAVLCAEAAEAGACEKNLAPSSVSPTQQMPTGPSSFRKVLICMIGGLGLGSWSPLCAMAQADFSNPAAQNRGLSPYGNVLFFTISIALSSLLFCPLLAAFPIDGTEGKHLGQMFYEYVKAPKVAHLLGWVGGIAWTIGTITNAVAGSNLSFAVSFGIGQACPMVGILWGVFFFREFDGTSRKVKVLLLLVCVAYLGAIAVIAASKR